MNIPSPQYLSRLANDCRSLASTLSYNEPEMGTIKYVLRESALAMDREATSIYRNKNGQLWVKNTIGQSRRLTLKERFCYWLLKGQLRLAC